VYIRLLLPNKRPRSRLRYFPNNVNFPNFSVKVEKRSSLDLRAGFYVFLKPFQNPRGIPVAFDDAIITNNSIVRKLRALCHRDGIHTRSIIASLRFSPFPPEISARDFLL